VSVSHDSGKVDIPPHSLVVVVLVNPPLSKYFQWCLHDIAYVVTCIIIFKQCLTIQGLQGAAPVPTSCPCCFVLCCAYLWSRSLPFLSALVCNLLPRRLFHGSPKAHCQKSISVTILTGTAWRTLGLFDAFPTCQFEPSSIYAVFWMISCIVVELRQPQVDFQVSTIVYLIFLGHHHKTETSFSHIFSSCGSRKSKWFFQFFRFSPSCGCRNSLNFFCFFGVAAVASRGKRALATVPSKFRRKWGFARVAAATTQKINQKILPEFGRDHVARGSLG